MALRPKLKRSAWFVGAVVCLAVVLLCMRQVPARAARTESVRNSKRAAWATPMSAPGQKPPTAPASLQAGPLSGWPNSQLRPLPVARESLYFEWTTPDAMDTNVLRLIAHNGLEYERLVEENARIVRRQLVYRKEPVDALVEHARAIGVPLKQLMVPGLDGQEFVVELAEADLHPSGVEGAFAGRLSGRPDSMVTVAFKGGREAFTVISPSDGIYLQGDPREPGEIIVKSIDPKRYVPGVCGTP